MTCHSGGTAGWTATHGGGGGHMTERRTEGGLDRRTLIKRAAIGGAIAWATPVITAVPAHATHGSPTHVTDSGFSHIAVVIQCGPNSNPTYYRMKWNVGADNTFPGPGTTAAPNPECGGFQGNCGVSDTRTPRASG